MRGEYLARLRQRMGAVHWDRECPVYNAVRGAELALATLIGKLQASAPVPGRGSPRPNEPQVAARPLTAQELTRLEANRRADEAANPQLGRGRRRR